MNKPVSFPIAKLLKEKGFDIPCQFLRVGGKYRINQEKEGDLFDNKYPSTQIPNDWFLAPTIAEVVMWLYEKHGIWINIGFSGDESCYLMVTNKIGEIKWNEKGFNSPIEAYESAFEHTLNNLI